MPLVGKDSRGWGTIRPNWEDLVIFHPRLAFFDHATASVCAYEHAVLLRVCTAGATLLDRLVDLPWCLPHSLSVLGSCPEG